MKKVFILIVVVIALSTSVYAESVNVICPYCESVGIEILSNEDGICKCNSCGEMMLILNGVIYTEDGKQYQLKKRINSTNKANNDEKKNESDAKENVNNSTNTINSNQLVPKVTEVYDEKRDYRYYSAEPEYDIETLSTKNEELRTSEINQSNDEPKQIDIIGVNCESVVVVYVSTRTEIIEEEIDENIDAGPQSSSVSAIDKQSGEIEIGVEDESLLQNVMSTSNMYIYILVVISVGIIGFIGAYNFRKKMIGEKRIEFFKRLLGKSM